MWSEHDEIVTFRLRKVREKRRHIWRRGCLGVNSRFPGIIRREVDGGRWLAMISCFMASARTIMTSTGPRSTHRSPHMYSAHLKRFVAHSDKRCPVSKSFFTHSSKCYSLSSSTTWPTLSALARFHLPSAVHSSRTRAVTSPIVELYLELHRHDFFMYMGSGTSEYSLS